MQKNCKSNGKSLRSCRKLAMDGGAKVRSKPWPARKLLGQAEKKAVDALFDKAIADHLILTVYESWGKREADDIIKIFKKVEALGK